MAVSVPVKIMNSRRRKQCSGNIFLVALVMEKKQDAITDRQMEKKKWASSSVDRPALDNLTLENKLGKTSIGCSADGA